MANTGLPEEPKGVIFVERHNKLVAEYQKIRGQCRAGDITHDDYKDQLNILKEREENLFWEVKQYNFMQEEVDQEHYFHRSLMKFPTPIGSGTTDVHFDKPCWAHVKLADEETTSTPKETDTLYQEIEASKNSPNKSNSSISEKQIELDSLLAEMRTMSGCVGPIPTDEQRTKMDTALDQIGELDFPFVSYGTSCVNGGIVIEILDGPENSNYPFLSEQEKTVLEKATLDALIDKGKTYHVDFIYVEELPRIQLQTSVCDSTTKKCDPLIGGALARESNAGAPCTISLAHSRNNWPWGINMESFFQNIACDMEISFTSLFGIMPHI